MTDAARSPDFQAMLNTVHVPEDAGEWADGLRTILERIPDGWGRYMDIGRGWYPIVVELDRKIAEIDPSYRVLQAKEKFAGLRYYTDNDGDPRIAALIREAEETSFKTCEVCGKTEGVTTEGPGWITSRCAECHARPTQLGQF